jgi:hypothetical protein
MKEITADLVLICRAGSEAQRKDPRILPQFSIMRDEVEPVLGYMAEHYPDVRYLMEYPTGGNP